MSKIENDFFFIRKITKQCMFSFVCVCVSSIIFSCLPDSIKGKEKENLWVKFEQNMQNINKDRNKTEKIELFADSLQEIEEARNYTADYEEKVNFKTYHKTTKKEWNKKLGSQYIRIKKNGKEEVLGYLENRYMDSQIVLNLRLEHKLGNLDDVITFVENGKELEGEREKSKKVENYVLTQSYQDYAEEKSIRISFQMKNVYAYELYQDKEYIYIAYREPREVYKNIVVVDVGHGGKDTGTYAMAGNWKEKDFNLDFARKIADVWESEDVHLYFTRLQDINIDLDERVNFANAMDADLFVSVHCNSSDEDSGEGLEVLYKTNKFAQESKKLAEKCLEELVSVTGMARRNLLNGNNIHIIRNANMPTVLLELGFLTDKEDIAFLLKEENREKMAKAICKSILDYIN